MPHVDERGEGKLEAAPEHFAKHAGKESQRKPCRHLGDGMHAQVHAGECGEKRVNEVIGEGAVADRHNGDGEREKGVERGEGKVKRACDFARRVDAGALFLQEQLEGNAKQEGYCHRCDHEGEQLLLLEKIGEHEDERNAEADGKCCVIECNRGKARLRADEPE